jgi:glycosyltransferase involved in cell wall biosynthesis
MHDLGNGGGTPRVLQITPRMAPSIGGVETHVREVTTRLPAHGIHTEVLTTDVSGTLPPIDEIDGVRVQRVPAWPRGSDLLIAPSILARVRDGGWDLVHVQCFHTFVAPLGMAAARRHGIPYVLTFHAGGHTSTLRERLRHHQVRAQRSLYRAASALIAIADFEMERYGSILGLPRERFVKIPNGSDLPQPSSSAGRAPGTLIVSSGRLESYKGHQRVIAAFPHVLEQIPDAHLWVAGRGPLEGELREQVRTLGLERCVEIGAVTGRQEMADRLSGASLGVMLSTFETQPLAALEAASLGVPLVVANNSGLAEIAERGLARGVELDDPPAAHAAAMVEQIRRPPAPAMVRLPSWDACAGSLAGLYRSVLAERRAAA